MVLTNRKTQQLSLPNAREAKVAMALCSLSGLRACTTNTCRRTKIKRSYKYIVLPLTGHFIRNNHRVFPLTDHVIRNTHLVFPLAGHFFRNTLLVLSLHRCAGIDCSQSVATQQCCTTAVPKLFCTVDQFHVKQYMRFGVEVAQ